MNNCKTLFEKILNLVDEISGKWWGQLILIALPILIIFIFISLNNRVVVDGDVLNGAYLTLHSFSNALRGKLNIFWDSNTLSGFTFITSMGFFSPFSIVSHRLFSDFLAVYHWSLALNLILAGFFTVRLLKEMELSDLAAIIGGLTFIISIYTVDLSLVNAYPLLPLIFWLLLLSFKKDRWWPILLGSLVIGLGWLSAHYNWLIIALSGGFIFSLSLGWIYHQKNWRGYLKMPVRYIVMVLLGSIIGLIQLLPFAVYTQSSSRLGGMLYQQASQGAVAFVDFVNFILPNFKLLFFSKVDILYLGILPLIFLILAIFTKSRLARFFSFLFSFCLILSINYSPLFWVLQKMPVFEYFRAPWRWMFLGLFAGSILAALGAENFLLETDKKLKIKILSIFKWVVLIITSISLLSSSLFYLFGSKLLDLLKKYFNLKIYSTTTRLPIEHYYKVIDDSFAEFSNVFNFLNIEFILLFTILIISYLAIRYFYFHKEHARYFLPSVVLIVGLNFIIRYPSSFSTIRKDLFNYHPQIAQFISENPGRTFSFLPGFTKYQKLDVPYNPDMEQEFIFQSELLTPKFNNLYNIKSVDGFDSMMFECYSEIIALIGSNRAMAGDKLSDLEIPLEDKIKLFQERHNLLDMLSVKYVISAYDLEDDYLTKVFTSEVTKYKIPIYVYENKDFLPLVYLAKEVKYLEPSSEMNLNIINDSANNFNKITFIECSDCLNVQNQEGKIEIEEYRSGYLELVVQVSDDSWLIFNENNLPGWRAVIDEQRTEIYQANNAFQAILIPAGQHKLVLSYNYIDILSDFFKLDSLL